MTPSEALRHRARQLSSDVAHLRRRLDSAAWLLDHYDERVGLNVLLINLQYVLGSSRDHTATERRG